MSTSRDNMLASIKRIIVPELRQRKFKGSFPHFRRIDGDTVNLLTIQFDRNGGGFVIELANWKGPAFKTHWGLEIPHKKLKAHDLNDRIRIYPDSKEEIDGTDSWFRYDRSETDEIFDEVSRSVIARLSDMEKYWNSIRNS